MKTLSVFNFMTLNGYYEGPEKGDISWHRHGGEESEVSVEGLSGGNILLFGRKTYELMVSYWPTPMALENDPVVAKGMNNSEKIVFSRTMESPEWSNTSLIKDNMVNEVKKLKEFGDKNLTILGSGSIVTQLADAGLIDEYQFMIDPLALGKGSSVFHGMNNKLEMKLTSSRVFKSGVIMLGYVPL